MKAIIDRFLKDIGMSMQYTDVGDMRQKLKLYDKSFGTDYTEQYDNFAYDIATKYNNNAEAYLAEYTHVKEAAMTDIKSRKEFKQFLEDKLEIPEYYNICGEKTSVYSATNDGEIFVSIDMHKANFNSLKYYGVFSEATWEEFLSKYTKNKHILDSKYIRQVILGNCNPKRQMHLERYIILQLFFIFRHGTAPLVDLFATGIIELAAISTDEIVIKFNDSRFIPTVLEAIHDAIDDFRLRLGFDEFKVEVFKLYCLYEELYVYSDLTTSRYTDNPKVLGYIRQFYDGSTPTSKWDCKCLDNVRVFILLAQFLGIAPNIDLFSVVTPYGPATLQHVTMPDFDWNKLNTDNDSQKTSIFS